MMDDDERFERWLHAHGFAGSVGFNIAFFTLQVIFYAVIILSLILYFRQ